MDWGWGGDCAEVGEEISLDAAGGRFFVFGRGVGKGLFKKISYPSS